MVYEGESRAATPCIVRNHPTTDDAPPWQGLSFRWSVGSDLLAEQLKNAYPDCKTLRQRKHKAAIEFLITELEEIRLKDEENSVPEVPNPHSFGSPKSEANKFHVQFSAGSMGQDTSSSTSSTSPHSVQSFQSLKMTDRSRSSTDTRTTPGTTNTSQHFVFSVVDGQTFQPKTKRRMTSPERVIYKERRKIGACDPCKRMKGKCTHNDIAGTMETKQGGKRKTTSKRIQNRLGSTKLKTTQESPIPQTVEIYPAVDPITKPQPPYQIIPSLPNDVPIPNDEDWRNRAGLERLVDIKLSPSSTSSPNDGSSPPNSPTPKNTGPTTSISPP